ncbi:MAG: branched-chain amino acid ABC transporter permease [Alphaproteobacteria bacterium]|nr:branched-chain amino acid ABC transporter permease [Alphaproteobacteria bacterium]
MTLPTLSRANVAALAFIVAMTAGLLAAPLFLKTYGVYLLSLWALNTVAAIGLNLTLGYAGQISLGQAAFLGIGAYAVAILMKAGVSFWLGLPAGVLLAFAVGLALGFPALRVQHHYLAFATLGFNALVFLVIRNEEWLTGGNFGIRVARPELLGHSLRSGIDYYHVCLAVLAVTALLVWLLLRSPWGRAFACLRDNPIRAESLGIDVRSYTLLAFAIGAACAGVAGAFLAPLVNFIDPSPFGLVPSIYLLLMVIIGGPGRFFGPFLGAAIVTLLPEWLRVADVWYLVIFGIFVVALMAFCPGGLLAVPEKVAAMRAARRSARGSAAGQAGARP